MTEQPIDPNRFGQTLRRLRLGLELGYTAFLDELQAAGRDQGGWTACRLTRRQLMDWEKGRGRPRLDTFVREYKRYFVTALGPTAADELERALREDLGTGVPGDDEDLLRAIRVDQVSADDEPTLTAVEQLMRRHLAAEECDTLTTYQVDLKNRRRWVFVAKADVEPEPQQRPPIPGGSGAVIAVLDFAFERRSRQVVLWYLVRDKTPTIVLPGGTREVPAGTATRLLMSAAAAIVDEDDALRGYEGVSFEVTASVKAKREGMEAEEQDGKALRFASYGADYGFSDLRRVDLPYLGPADLEKPVWEDDAETDPKGIPMLLMHGPLEGRARLEDEAVRQCIYDAYRDAYIGDSEYIAYLDLLQAKAERLNQA